MQMKLSPIQERFVVHWGEMGARWGVNRTMAQIHALLFITSKAMNAEEIAETLSVARSNVSTSLRELQGWGVVRSANLLGDRRDHFESIKDVWEMFRVVMDERKKREWDPTQAVLRECVEEARKADEDPATRERLENMLEFFTTMGSWYEQMRRLPTGMLIKLLKLGDKVGRVLGMK
jgi:DNA-binding transcriptional regulator GbsR (MarR family)